VQGQNFTIQLQSNPSTGFHWEPQFDSTALSLTESVFINGPNPHNLVGVPGSQNFTFQGIKPGTSIITFNNISPSNQTANSLTATATVTAADPILTSTPTPTATPTPTQLTVNASTTTPAVN
jgi:predicted secreted protein